MTITKINEKTFNIEKDNQTITLSWRDVLDLLEIAIYGEPGEKTEIIIQGERRKENVMSRSKQ